MSERLLGVLTAMKGRHEVAKVMLRSIPRELRGWRVLVLVVMDRSDVESMRPFLSSIYFDKRMILYSIAENSPLTLKWQHGLSFLKNLNIDALCLQGSDDFASEDYWQAGVDRIREASRPFGVRSCWMLEKATGRMGYFSMGSEERPVGCGRFYPKSVLDAVGWVLWDEPLDRGLDGATEERLGKFDIKFDVVEMPGLVVDVKDESSMNRFENFLNFLGAGLNRFDKLVEREETEKILNEGGLGSNLIPLIGKA